MDDLEGKINSLLSSPGSMEKILEMARTLSGGSFGGAGTEGNTEQQPSASSAAPASPEAPASTAPAASTASPASLLAGFPLLDPSILGVIGRFVSEYGASDERYRLITDLKAHLSSEKWATIDKAVQFAKLSRAARTLFSPSDGGEKHV